MAKTFAEVHRELVSALTERIAAVDLTRALELYPDVEALADRMIDSLPDQFVSEPLIGPCYSTSALAKWKRVSRQAITHQRKVGTLFAVAHKGNYLYPSSQFDHRGRQMAAFREVWTRFSATGGDPLAFAVWLQTPDPDTGVAPAAKLAHNPDGRITGQMFLEDFTIIQPPFAPVNSDRDK